MQTLAKGKATPIHSHAHCEVRNMSCVAQAHASSTELAMSHPSVLCSLSMHRECISRVWMAAVNKMLGLRPYMVASRRAGGEHRSVRHW